MDDNQTIRDTAPPMGDAMGYLEVSGYVAAVLASDAMSKTARVTLETVHKTSGALVCVYVRGLLADCRESIAAGKAVAERCNALVGGSVLGRPDDDTVAIWTVHIPAMKQRKAARKAKAGPDLADAAGTDKTGQPDQTDQTGQPDQPDQTGKTGQPDKTDQPGKSEDSLPEPGPAQPTGPAQAGRPDKPDKPDKDSPEPAPDAPPKKKRRSRSKKTE